eukprot:TRINITY_DN184_c0_g1_i4.p1 TRINITY_DN184_c0_g1~~TRINITY_DN184_c0_g1_i4.p1  ORF type:complete len:608 (+),score=192.53 TRINITY_DN184_c0_g1_i4:20-1843(+)
MSRLDTNDRAIDDALRDVSGPSSTDWVLFEHVAKTNKLHLVESGDDGLEEMLYEINDGRVQFYYIRFDIGGGMFKYVYIPFCGDGVSGMLKGNFANHAIDMCNHIKRGFPMHLQVNARNEDDIDEDDIISKLKVATGANYDAGDNKQGLSEGVIASVKGSIDHHTNQIQEAAKIRKRDRSGNYIDVDASATYWNSTRTNKLPEVPKEEPIIDAAASQKYWNEQNKSSTQSTTQKANVVGSSQGAGNLAAKFEQEAATKAQPTQKPAGTGKVWQPPPKQEAPPPAAKPYNPPPSKPAGPPPTQSYNNPPPAIPDNKPPSVPSNPPPSQPAGPPPTQSYNNPPPAIPDNKPPSVPSNPPPSQPAGPPPTQSYNNPPPAIPDNKPPSVPSNPPPAIPGNKPPSVPSNPPPGVPNNPPPSVPSNPPPGVPSNPPPGVPNNPPPSVPSNPPPGVPSNPPPGVPNDPPPSVPSNPPPGVPNDPPPSVPSNPPPGVPNDPPPSVPSSPPPGVPNNPPPSVPSSPPPGVPNNPPPSVPSSPPPEPAYEEPAYEEEYYYEVVQALYAFQGETESDLSFEAGDTIYVLEKDPNGWWQGQHENGSIGEFPSNFTMVIE